MPDMLKNFSFCIVVKRPILVSLGVLVCLRKRSQALRLLWIKEADFQFCTDLKDTRYTLN